MMRLRKYDNRRAIGWLLTLALLAMGLPSRATWQCLNGTPCPANCPILRGNPPISGMHSSFQTGKKTSQCAHCAVAQPTGAVTSSTKAPGCSSPRCVLIVRSHATIALAAAQHFIMPLLALPPPVLPMAASTLAILLPTSTTLLPLPERYLHSCSGRAPPLPLS